MKNTIKIIITLLALLFTTVAQASNLFEPTSNDLSIKILAQIFGGLIENSHGADPALSALKMFNSGVLIIGGILAGYTILSGTIGTAHDGEMMGKKFSSVWIPIRYSVGTALILPVIGGGYCVIQGIVMWLVVQGIGLADQTWIAYMSTTSERAEISTQHGGSNGVLALAENLFTSNMCVNALNSAQTSKWFFKQEYTTINDKNNLFFGNSKNAVSHYECGKVVFPDLEKKNKIRGNKEVYKGKLGNIDEFITEVDFTPILEEHKKQTTILNNKIASLANEVSQEEDINRLRASQIYLTIETYAYDYEKEIEKAANALTSKVNFKMKNSASSNGWFTAGFTYFNQVSLLNDIKQSVNSYPASISNYKNFTEGGSHYEKDAQPKLSIISAVLSNSISSQVARDLNSQHQEQETGSSFAAKISTSIAQSFTGINLLEIESDNRHPLIMMSEIGHSLNTAMTNMMLILATVAGVAGSGALIAGSGVVAATNIFGNFFGWAVNGMWGIAWIASWLIPNLPAILWTGAILGFVLLVVEAVIAAPLWAIMHLHPNGDDVTGKGGGGYSLLLSLLLRPVLMIFGFIFSLEISAIFGEFINKIYFSIFSNVDNADGFNLFFKMLFGTGLYCIFMYILVRKSFQIVTMIPDQILRWISGPVEQMGQFSGEFESGTNSAMKVGAAATVGATTLAANSLTNTLKPKPQPPAAAGSNGGGGSGGNNPNTTPGQTYTGQLDENYSKEQLEGMSDNPSGSEQSSNPDGFTAQKAAADQAPMNKAPAKKPPYKNDGSEGVVTNFGTAPYRNKEGNKPSFFIETADKSGNKTTTWGNGLKSMMKDNNISKGDSIKFSKGGSKDVVTTDNEGNTIDSKLNSWNLNYINKPEVKPAVSTPAVEDKPTSDDVQPSEDNTKPSV